MKTLTSSSIKETSPNFGCLKTRIRKGWKMTNTLATPSYFTNIETSLSKNDWQNWNLSRLTFQNMWNLKILKYCANWQNNKNDDNNNIKQIYRLATVSKSIFWCNGLQPFSSWLPFKIHWHYVRFPWKAEKESIKRTISTNRKRDFHSAGLRCHRRHSPRMLDFYLQTCCKDVSKGKMPKEWDCKRYSTQDFLRSGSFFQ